MRRSLVALVLASSLLWAAGGIAVLAVAAHEHLHHTAPHDHGRALRTAAHGHVHETEPDHDHHLAALPAVARAVSLVTVLAAAVMVFDGVVAYDAPRVARRRA